MIQRVFDVKNEKDMADLWNILPDDIVRICPMINRATSYLEYKDDEGKTDLFKINWHDKTEITRPIPEATEQDIGKICVFYDKFDGTDDEPDIYAVLHKIENECENTWFYTESGDYYLHCRRLTKQEIEELC